MADEFPRNRDKYAELHEIFISLFENDCKTASIIWINKARARARRRFRTNRGTDAAIDFSS